MRNAIIRRTCLLLCLITCTCRPAMAEGAEHLFADIPFGTTVYQAGLVLSDVFDATINKEASSAHADNDALVSYGLYTPIEWLGMSCTLNLTFHQGLLSHVNVFYGGNAGTQDPNPGLQNATLEATADAFIALEERLNALYGPADETILQTARLAEDDRDIQTKTLQQGAHLPYLLGEIPDKTEQLLTLRYDNVMLTLVRLSYSPNEHWLWSVSISYFAPQDIPDHTATP